MYFTGDIMNTLVAEAIENLNITLEFAITGDSTNASDIRWLTSGTRPTDAEIQTEIDRVVSEYPMTLLREERNRLLSKSDWRVTVANETGTSLSNEWKTYRQALRDLPASSTPKLDSYNELDLTSVSWPTEPS
tara:strand:+ start:128 stop:526 length:399 start_codon:yes stop_codon:yes gene_type:complete